MLPGQSPSPDNTSHRPITAHPDSPKQLSAKPDNGDRLCSQVGIPTVFPRANPDLDWRLLHTSLVRNKDGLPGF